MLTPVLTLLGGLVLLIVGGELLVRGAVRIAERLGMSQLLIGLTIVGFGTSAPELVASVEAARAGAPGIAWGNIVGSNIANSLLILGLASLILPMAVPRGPLWRDGGLALVATGGLWLLAAKGQMGGMAGAAFLGVLILYLGYAYYSELSTGGAANTAVGEKAEALEMTDTHLHDKTPLWRSGLIFLGGLIGILFGGRWLVSGAVEIAQYAGLSEAVIGMTVIAIGTSLPEAVTAVIAALKKAGDVALGNVLGSNIFNLLLIGGVTASVAPGALPVELISFGLPFLFGASLVLMLLASTGHRLSRWEGGVLLAAYIGQIIYSLASTG